MEFPKQPLRESLEMIEESINQRQISRRSNIDTDIYYCYNIKYEQIQKGK